MDTAHAVLDDVVVVFRAANAALAASIAAAVAFYDTRMAEFDTGSLPVHLDAERTAHTSAIAELACATLRPAGAVQAHLDIWWGSRAIYRDMFTVGTISLEVLRTIRDHTMGAPAAIIAALEPDIVLATAHFTPTRLGKEIDRMITALDPDWDTRARTRAAAKKNVRLTRLPRGMARQSATIGARDAAELTALLDAEMGRVCGLDPRSLDTRRADAYTALFRGGHLTCLCSHPDCVDGRYPDDPGRDRTDQAEKSDQANKTDESGSSSEADTDTDTDTDTDGGGTDGGGTDGGGTDSGTDGGTDDSGTDADVAARTLAANDSGHCLCGRALPPYLGPSVSDSIRYPHGATVRPSRPLIHITADLGTVLGLHNRSAHLHGYGPLDPTTLRTLARDATWQIIFTTSRRYLDTLTDTPDPPLPPPPPEPAVHTPHCTCNCGTPPRTHDRSSSSAVRDPFADLLAAAAAEHDRHATHLPTRMSAPTRAQAADDRRRAELLHHDRGDDAPDKREDPDKHENPDDRDDTNHPDDRNDSLAANDTTDRGDGMIYDPDLLADLTEPERASTAPDLILGRTQPVPAGYLPDPPPTPPRPPAPARTAAGLAEHYRRIVADDPHHAHAEHPDGHGGHPTPPPGALTYTPGAALAMYVRAQHPTCRHPGCTVRSSRCDLDHIVEYDHHHPERGGWTIAANLAPYCRTHHNLKTSKHWHTERLAHDVIHTTDPHGNHYFHPPEL